MISYLRSGHAGSRFKAKIARKTRGSRAFVSPLAALWIDSEPSPAMAVFGTRGFLCQCWTISTMWAQGESLKVLVLLAALVSTCSAAIVFDGVVESVEGQIHMEPR